MKGRIGLAVTVATLAFAGSANASRVGIAFYDGDIGVTGGYSVDYIADPGEVNQPTVTLTNTGVKVITIHDPSATISPDPPAGEFVLGEAWHYDETPCTLLDSHTAK